MTSVYVFGVIIAVLFVSGLVLAPILEDEPADPNAGDEGGSPADRREAALDALEELRFEHETGKLSDADYRRLKSKYARAAVAARRQEEGGSEAAAGGAAPPSAADPSASGTSEEEAVTCPECGSEAERDARFCAQCGTELPA